MNSLFSSKKAFTLPFNKLIVFLIIIIAIVFLISQTGETIKITNWGLDTTKRLAWQQQYKIECETSHMNCDRIIKDCSTKNLADCTEEEIKKYKEYQNIIDCDIESKCSNQEQNKWDNFKEKYFMPLSSENHELLSNNSAYNNDSKVREEAQENTNIKTQPNTWDSITNQRIKTLHPEIRQKATDFINNAYNQNIKLRITSALRTIDQQNKLYSQGRTAPGNIVTNAKGGQSYHNYGLAIDVVEIKNNKALWNNPNWDKIGSIGKNNGFEWGGDWNSFKDKPHFQYTFEKSTKELYALYESEEKDGEYVILT